MWVFITTKKFPSIFKISRITPFLKPDKISFNISSYRPINNLSAIEKLIEQHLKDCMTDFLDQNNIILDNHHGSRTLHSTTTALATINDYTNDKYYDNYYTALIQTDLSAAFDTVDHSILLDKLDFYGFRGDSNDLLRSLLEDRKQFVSIDGKE